MENPNGATVTVRKFYNLIDSTLTECPPTPLCESLDLYNNEKLIISCSICIQK